MDMTRKAGMALAALAALGFAAASPAQAAPGDYGLYDTGVDGSGHSLPGETVGDPHYTLYIVPAGATNGGVKVLTYAAGSAISPYIPDSTTSAWISPIANQSFGAEGLYDYQTTFTLTQTQADTFSIAGLWSTDNAGADILINKNSTGNTLGTHPGDYNGFQSYVPFTVNSNFKAGVNTLDFIVYNAPGSPTALRVDSIQGTVAPEPSSFAVFGFLGLGMAGLMFKARKRSASAA